MNNEKQLLTALRNYETSKRELPGYANGIAKGAAGASDLHGRLATWVIMLFPYMERTDVWSQWSDSSIPNDSLPAPYMELLVCPSNQPATLDAPWLAYVANCGRKDSTTGLVGTSPPQSPTTAAGKKAEKLANGIFFNRFNIPGSSGDFAVANFMQFSMSLDKIPDGASNTLILSENTAAFKYTYWDNGTSSRTFGVSGDGTHQYTKATDAECATGFIWDADSTTPPSSRAAKINGTDKTLETKKFDYQIAAQANGTDLSTPKAYTFARPSSYHPGGVNAAFCGGEVIFLNEGIDYKVYEQLMTTDGKHSDMQDPTYLLQDSDYK